MLRAFGKIAIAVVMLGAALEGASAEETRLLFTSLSPAGSPNSVFFNAWAKRIEEKSAGALKIDVRDGTSLANFGNAYDRVMSDVVQIGWVQPAFVAGKFPLSEISNLPFLTDDNVNCSVSLWRFYSSSLMKEELKDVVPVFTGCLAQTGAHFSKPLHSNDDLSGLKIRVSGKVPSRIVTLMGGSPVSMTAESIYESLQRGTIDGTITSWAAFEPYKLQEVAFYHLEVPIGSSPSMFMMSRKKFESLPESVRKVLMDNSGETMSRLAGKHFGDQADRARNAVAHMEKHTIAKLTPSELATWEQKVTPVQAEWAKDRSGGEQAISEFKKIYAKVKAGQ